KPFSTNDDLEVKRNEARRSQMSLDTLRTVAERLQLDMSGNKTDLIERITMHCPKATDKQGERSTPQAQTDEIELDDSPDYDLRTMLDEETSEQAKSKKRKGKQKEPVSSTTSSSSSDTEMGGYKRARKAPMEDSDIRNLLNEIKELRKDMNSVNSRVEETWAKTKIEEEWPEERFERSRDQHEYNLL
ncbi:12924_t:CDS:1, partial [Cetraspora pellucida]